MAEGMDKGGVKINLISRETLASMSSEQRVEFILSQVLSGTVLVLEQGLTPIEEAELYKRTMSTIDQDTFIGIEIQGIAPSEIRRRNILQRLLGMKRREVPRMSVIGPAHLLRTIYKDGRQIQAVIVTKAPMGGVEGGEVSPATEGEEGEKDGDYDGLFSDIENAKGEGFTRPIRAIDVHGSDVYRVVKSPYGDGKGEGHGGGEEEVRGGAEGVEGDRRVGGDGKSVED